MEKIDVLLARLDLDNQSSDSQIDVVEKVFQTTRKECTRKIHRPKMKLPADIMLKIREEKPPKAETTSCDTARKRSHHKRVQQDE